jgi:hypothetical protein
LVVGGMSVKQIPDEYIDYVLCDKFGWLPSEIDIQDEYLLQTFLEIMRLENVERDRVYKRIEK